MGAKDDIGAWADLIEASQPEIVERWAREVLADPSVPEANRLSRPELVDDVPPLLRELVGTLRSGGESAGARTERAERALDAATKHGHVRAASSYGLGSAVRELAILRRVLAAVCLEHGRPLVGPAASISHEVIDAALGQAVVAMEQTFRQQLTRERNGATEANAEKDAFLTFLSHEARNALNVILGWSSLAEDADERSLRKALVIIERNAKVLHRLIDDLLQVRRARLGKLGLVLGPVDVCELLSTTVEGARPTAAAAGLLLEAPRCDRPAMVRGDADRLIQVFRNLLDNAIKFTPPGGRIQVSLALRGPEIVITIRDTGAGIAPEMLDSIFEPFRQGDVGWSGGGVGLGLALVRELVDRHGGDVRAESGGRGRGATFVVMLPRRESDQQAA